MRLKSLTIILFFIVVGALALSHSGAINSFVSEQSPSARESHVVASSDNNKYVCPMHSHIVSHEADECPICGMELVINTSRQPDALGERTTGIESSQQAEVYPEVRISPLVVHNLGIRSELVERGNLSHRIETIGKITRVDPMARSRITSPISGTIIEMVDKYSGAKVQQDEFLFSVASEELFALEKAFQQAFMQGDKPTASGMIPKLVSMGLDAHQVAQLQNGAEPIFPAKVFAREDGFVFTRRGGEGEPVTSSFTVFNLGGNYQVIEVTVEIFERQWDLVKEGQKASMQLRNLPGKIFYGTVERVDEPVGYTTRALESRLKFKTDHQGMTQSTFARVIIDGKSKQDVLLVSRDAVIRTAAGERVVTLTEDGRFQPVSVTIGEEANGRIEIVTGLLEGQRVVVSGQFLLDSESNLMAGLNRISNSEPPNPIREDQKH